MTEKAIIDLKSKKDIAVFNRLCKEFQLSPHEFSKALLKFATVHFDKFQEFIKTFQLYSKEFYEDFGPFSLLTLDRPLRNELTIYAEKMNVNIETVIDIILRNFLEIDKLGDSPEDVLAWARSFAERNKLGGG